MEGRGSLEKFGHLEEGWAKSGEVWSKLFGEPCSQSEFFEFVLKKPSTVTFLAVLNRINFFQNFVLSC